MPRPKVRLEDRQRSARACKPCKSSKIRCDAKEPCGPCSKRRRVEACVYGEQSRKRSTPASVSTADSRVSPLQYHHDDAQSTYQDLTTADVQEASSTVINGAVTPREATPTPENPTVSRALRGRLLLSSKGEQLYVGESASLSFLQFLRNLLKSYMGPSAFTESSFKDSMLEVEMARDDSPDVSLHDQSHGEKYILVQLYREATSGILDLYSTSELTSILDQHVSLSLETSGKPEDPHHRADQTALHMILAIGYQCRARSPMDARSAVRSFTHAQRSAFEGFLCDPTIGMVRVFLLMAFYMLGACHRNAAYMYLGVASKAACALGLHHKERIDSLTLVEVHVRSRIWRSLLILDTLVSALLGRPGGLPQMRRDDGMREIRSNGSSDPDSVRSLTSRAAFAICSKIIELQQKLVTGGTFEGWAAEQFLGRLRQWNESLPSALRHFETVKNHVLGPAERELFIGATHVACAYYFTIILVTRPFFTSALISRIQNTMTRGSELESPNQSQVSNLAQACLDAATFMAKTGLMAINSGIPSNNLCILKAWMFAAGLLLGFSMFVEVEPTPDVDFAFSNAVTVLGQLSGSSQQAAHYHGILTAFSDAIYHHREKLHRAQQRSSDRFVSQVFTADFHGSDYTLHHNVPSSSAMSSAHPISDTGGKVPFNLDPAMFNESHTSMSELSPAYWSDMPMLSDNLFIDWDTIWPTFDG